jgi:hypothetical protein
MFVDHDVAIMSVFDLEEVAHQRIGCHAPDKVGSSLGEVGEREGGFYTGQLDTCAHQCTYECTTLS